MKKVAVLATLALASLSSFANANKVNEGWYLGGGVGNTGFDIDGYDTNVEPDGNALKMYGGYKFNRIVSAEVAYTSYGDLKYKQGYALAGQTAASPSSISLSANLGYTFDSGWRPFVILGLSSVDLDAKQAELFYSDSGTGAHTGLGLEYSLKSIDGLTMRLAYEADTFEVESQFFGMKYTQDYTVDSAYFGVSYAF